ncbi:MAG TPA: ABC transporter permease [Deltaproteobacteria bacterium]|nr:ABC transporter permease [Deltaproteobacteria bacterium]HIJ35964.1 ABC transporter permease [Deltaproteobacteria bacterium]HIJ41211.1 ABC transporter permease [Deltaproteobacteria bacterium]
MTNAEQKKQVEAPVRFPWLESFLEGWSIFKQNLLGKIGLSLLVMFALMAVFSYLPPLINPMYNPMTGVDPNILGCTGPSLKHWLGTDFMGRDILSQLLAGARVAFMVGVSAAVMSIALGTAIGMTAGYLGKFTDTVLMRLADMIMVMPTLLVVLLLAAVFGQLNIWTIVLIIALFRWPGVSRIIRGQTLSLKQRPFVEAAKVAGASHMRIIFRHIMPNVLPLAFLFMTFRVTSAIITEAALAFLGFGDPGTVSWGMMLQWVWKTGNMFQAPYWLLPPGICISLITLSFYMLGRAMDEVLDPRLRKEDQTD